MRSPYWPLYYNHDPGSVVRSAGRVFPLLPDRVVVIPEDVLFELRVMWSAGVERVCCLNHREK